MNIDPTFIDKLAQIVYTTQGMEAAAQYLSTRGVDTSLMEFPPTVSGENPNAFLEFRDQYPLHIFTECLFYPILEMSSVNRPQGTLPVLAGFDVRYLGTNPNRTRFQKFKREPTTTLLYNFSDYFRNPTYPLVVAEGVADVETFRALKLPINVISPLTAASNEGFVSALYAMSDNIWFAYDNDAAGQKAIKNIWEIIDRDQKVAQHFNIFFYQGKDPNKALAEKGAKYLSDQVKEQILSYTPPQKDKPIEIVL